MLVPLLQRLLPSEALALAEAAFDLLPATPATVRLILAVMARCARILETHFCRRPGPCIRIGASFDRLFQDLRS